MCDNRDYNHKEVERYDICLNSKFYCKLTEWFVPKVAKNVKIAMLRPSLLHFYLIIFTGGLSG